MGGGALPDFLLLSFTCSAGHEGNRPPCKVVFFGLATNTLNVRNNKQQIHDGMRACVRLDDSVCSGCFAVEEGLHGCVLAPLLFNVFLAEVINVASTRFKATKVSLTL